MVSLSLHIAVGECFQRFCLVLYTTGVVHVLVMCSLGDDATLGGSNIYGPTSVLHTTFCCLFSLDMFISILGCNQKSNNRSCGQQLSATHNNWPIKHFRETTKETQTGAIQSGRAQRQRLDTSTASEDAHGDEKIKEDRPLHLRELYRNPLKQQVETYVAH